MAGTIKNRAKRQGYQAGLKGIPLEDAWRDFVKIEGHVAVASMPGVEQRFRVEHGFGYARHQRPVIGNHRDMDEQAWKALFILFRLADEHHEAVALEDVNGAEAAWKEIVNTTGRIVDLARSARLAYDRNKQGPFPTAREAGRVALHVKHMHALYHKQGIVRADQTLDVQRARHTLLEAVDRRLDSRRWVGGSTTEERDAAMLRAISAAREMFLEARETLEEPEQGDDR